MVWTRCLESREDFEHSLHNHGRRSASSIQRGALQLFGLNTFSLAGVVVFFRGGGGVFRVCCVFFMGCDVLWVVRVALTVHLYYLSQLAIVFL